MKKALASAGSINSRALVLLVILVSLSVGNGFAQEEPKMEVLVEGIENGYFVAAENKFSVVDDQFANFFGAYGGWLINHRFLLGAGGYGMTNRVYEMQMGYGGLVLEYFINPNSLVNFSVKGLIGGGSSSYSWWDAFFVAEPELRMGLNLTERIRLGFGGGYRFVEGSCRSDDRLSGYTISLDLKFGAF
jgi:hypothetical protein